MSPKTIRFTQIDSIHARIIGLDTQLDGRKTTILLLNNAQKFEADATHDVFLKLTPYLNTDIQLQLTGKAEYFHEKGTFELSLIKFEIHHFEELEEVTLEEWIESFRGKGASKWDEFKDSTDEPMNTLKS